MTHPLPGVGVFGTGTSARAIIYFLQSSGFNIEAIWGRTEDEAKDIADIFNIPFYTSHIDDLLLNQHVDLVCINSPPFLQSEIAVKTLGIGKNVLCERPAGLGYDDAERMLTASRYYPSLMSLMTYHLRFLPTFQEMRNRIHDGYIGDMMIVEVRVHSGSALDMQYNWSHDSRMGGGALSTFGGHFVDLVNFISGQKATKVHGFLTTFQKQTNQVTGFREVTSDDFCTIQMKLDKGSCCTCIINNNLPGQFSYEVLAIGTKACLVAKDGMLYGELKSPEINTEGQNILAQDGLEIPPGFANCFSACMLQQMPTPLSLGLLKFTESLKGSFMEQDDRRRWDKSALSCAATFEDALYVQSVLESVRKSSKTSDWEQVDMRRNTSTSLKDQTNQPGS